MWNKKWGDDEERLGGDRRDVAKDRHKNKRETEISERKLFRMLSPKINCIWKKRFFFLIFVISINGLCIYQIKYSDKIHSDFT